MYTEITKEFFDVVVTPEIVNIGVKHDELCTRIFYKVHGVTLQVIQQYTSKPQYYIQDINA